MTCLHETIVSARFDALEARFDELNCLKTKRLPL